MDIWIYGYIFTTRFLAWCCCVLLHTCPAWQKYSRIVQYILSLASYISKFNLYYKLFLVIFLHITLFNFKPKKKYKKIHPPPKYKKYLIWPIKYIKHYKSTEYIKSIIWSTNMIGNEKQKTWQKNTIFTSKMLKGLCPC